MEKEVKKEVEEKKVIIKTGPNLFLFSIALLLAIFASYTVGSLVSKKANEKRELNSKEKVEETSNSNSTTNKKYNKNIVKGKSYINVKEGSNESSQSIYYFYEDNTYYLQNMGYDEYGTYDIENDELVLYSIFAYTPGLLEPVTALGGKTVAQFEKGYIVFYQKNNNEEESKVEYKLESSNISGSLSNTMIKLQNEINTKVYCD